VAALLTAPRLAGTAAGARVPERVYGLVRGLPLFASLPVATLENLALRLEERPYGAGEEIVHEGDVGDAFYVIADGEVDVDIGGAHRRRQGPGEFFGEIALLHDVPRTATISAATPVIAMAIEREAFLAAIGAHVRSSGAAEAAARDRLAADATLAS
jgi:CRP-like cAMP-binding protein